MSIDSGSSFANESVIPNIWGTYSVYHIIISLVRFFILKKCMCISAGIHSYMITRVGTPTFDRTEPVLKNINGSLVYFKLYPVPSDTSIVWVFSLHSGEATCMCTLNTKYVLGHFICSDLSDDTDILRQRRCLTIQGHILLRKFHMCSIGVRLALFRSFCSPMCTSQLWWNYKKCTMKRLLITYHNIFKMSISMSKYESTSVLCTVYNVLCCQAVIRNIVYRFMCRLQASNNSLVMYIQSSSLVYTSRIRKHWRRLLYVYG